MSLIEGEIHTGNNCVMLHVSVLLSALNTVCDQ